MGINKVQYGNTTLIDLTSDTVVAEKLVSGYTAHDASGLKITGSLNCVNYYSGTSSPDNTIGNDGDIYIKI